MKRRHFNTLISMAVLFSALSVSAVAQESADTLWRYDAPEKLTYFRLVEDTLLLSGTNLGLECLNASDGTVLWRKTMEDSVSGWSAGNLQGVPYLLMLRSHMRTFRASRFQGGGLTQTIRNNMSVMNVHTGEELWSSADNGIYSVVGYFPTPDSTRLILFTTDTARVRSIRCVDFHTGEPVWVNDSVYRNKGPVLTHKPSMDSLNLDQQQPVFDSDSSMITFLSKGTIRKWNWRTGSVIWETKLSRNDVAPVSDGFMQMRLNTDGTRLYVPANKYLFCLDARTGKALWESPKMYGNVYQMEDTEYGLLVRGGYFESGKGGYKDYLIALDPETGQYKWKKQLTKFKTPRTSNFVTFGDVAYVYSDRNLYQVSIADGSYDKIAEKMDVLGNIRLFKSGEQIQLISGETVALMNTDATMVFNSSHKLPGGSGFWSTLSTIVTVAVLVAAVASASSAAYSGNGGGYYYVPTVSYGVTRFSELAVAGDSSICMVTKVETASGKKTPGIIRVRFSDGETIASEPVGDKSPVYTFSEKLSMLFTVHDETSITAFRF